MPLGHKGRQVGSGSWVEVLSESVAELESPKLLSLPLGVEFAPESIAEPVELFWLSFPEEEFELGLLVVEVEAPELVFPVGSPLELDGEEPFPVSEVEVMDERESVAVLPGSVVLVVELEDFDELSGVGEAEVDEGAEADELVLLAPLGEVVAPVSTTPGSGLFGFWSSGLELDPTPVVAIVAGPEVSIFTP